MAVGRWVWIGSLGLVLGLAGPMGAAEPTGGAAESEQAPAADAERRPPAAGHRLLLVRFDGAAFSLVRDRHVASPLPKHRAGRRPRPWRLQLEDAAGAVVYRAGLADPTVLRGEFHGDSTGRIEAVHIEQTKPVVFPVRLPAAGGQRLVFERLRKRWRRDPQPPAAAWRELGTLDLGGEQVEP